MKSTENNQENISKETNLMKLVAEHPEVVPILTGYGLHCVGCAFSAFDTLENGAKIHGMDKETFDMMLRDINAVISEGIELSD